jgi:uncharacterized protein YggE
MKRKSCIATLLTLPGLVMSPSLHGAEGHMEPVPSVNVVGSAEISAAPDRATVRLGATAQKPTAREAQAEVNRVANAILAGLTSLGIARDDIQTSELNLYPVYAQSDPRPVREAQEPRIVGYQASNVVAVHLTDLAKIGPAIDAGLAAGANRLEGVSFELADELPVRLRALREAAVQARAKAAAIAEAVGAELGPILQLSEGSVSIDVPRFALARAGAAEFAGADTPVSPGQIRVRAEVSARYRISP